MTKYDVVRLSPLNLPAKSSQDDGGVGGLWIHGAEEGHGFHTPF